MDKKIEVGATPPVTSGEMRTDELAALYSLTDSLYRANTQVEILDAALNTITAVLGTRASILLFDDAGVMRFKAWRGLSDHYRTKLEGHSPWQPGFADPQPILVEDIASTDEPQWVKAAIKSEGICGLAFIPLVSRRKVIGKFMTYYPEPHQFQSSEIDLALTIARQLGFSLERLRADEELRESEERFRLMSEQAPVMIWMSDANGGCLHLNRMLRAFWGVENTELRDFDWQRTLHPDDSGAVERAVMGAITGRKGLSVEGRYRNSEGVYRMLRTTAHPRFSSSGEFLGMVGVNIDLTERYESEAALRESEERLRVALAAGRMGTWRYDLTTEQQSWDERQYELFGLPPSEPPSRDLFLSVVHPDDLSFVQFDLDDLPDGESFLDSEFRIIRPDGATRWIMAHALARSGADGKPVELIGVNFDITDQKENEEGLRLLLAELNHRVKNTLAVVQGLAFQTFKDGQATIEARKAFEGRLIALATAHNLLTQSNWENASLESLAMDVLDSQGVDKGRLAIHGPQVSLSSKAALALVLVLHELGTNALKYGALSNDSGGIDIRWHIDSARILRFMWREYGGPRVSPPKRIGFGSRLIEHAVERDLDANVMLDFASGGVVYTIEVPLHKLMDLPYEHTCR